MNGYPEVFSELANKRPIEMNMGDWAELFYLFRHWGIETEKYEIQEQWERCMYDLLSDIRHFFYKIGLL